MARHDSTSSLTTAVTVPIAEMNTDQGPSSSSSSSSTRHTAPTHVMSPSALTSFVTRESNRASCQDDPLYRLALEVAFNLKYEHRWTHLCIHTHQSTPDHSQSQRPRQLPRPLISGLPPTRVYVHPDDQINELRQNHRNASASASASAGNADSTVSASTPETAADSSTPPPPPPQSAATPTAATSTRDEAVDREWVLPTRLREKWSLAKFAGIFDGIREDPSDAVHGFYSHSTTDTATTTTTTTSAEEMRTRTADVSAGERDEMARALVWHDERESTDIEPVLENEEPARKVRRGQRRGGKRVLLATLGEDSTVVYYIVHEGVVKPRQN